MRRTRDGWFTTLSKVVNAGETACGLRVELEKLREENREIWPQTTEAIAKVDGVITFLFRLLGIQNEPDPEKTIWEMYDDYKREHPDG